MREKGLKASELIQKIQKLIEEHGDREVISGGTDYPEGVRGVSYQQKDNDPYIPKGSFYI